MSANDEYVKSTQAVKIIDIKTPIDAPPQVRLAPEKGPTDKRVAASEDWIRKKLLNLFHTEKEAWKVADAARRIN